MISLLVHTYRLTATVTSRTDIRQEHRKIIRRTYFAMNSVLGTVAIVAFVATTNAALLEYDDRLSEQLSFTEPDAAEIPASVINAETTRTLVRWIDNQPDTVTLISDGLEEEQEQPPPPPPPPIPQPQPQEGNHPVCRASLGIDLNNGQSFFCDMSSIQIQAAYDEEKGTHIVVISVYFAMHSNKPFVLDIPVFNRPFEYEAAGKEQQFKDWAADKKVGIHFPMNEQELIDVRQDSVVPVSYVWLNELLAMGITKRPSQIINFVEGLKEVQDSYASRPLVLRKDVSEKLLELVYWREYVDDDADLPSTSISGR